MKTNFDFYSYVNLYVLPKTSTLCFKNIANVFTKNKKHYTYIAPFSIILYLRNKSPAFPWEPASFKKRNKKSKGKYSSLYFQFPTKYSPFIRHKILDNFHLEKPATQARCKNKAEKKTSLFEISFNYRPGGSFFVSRETTFHRWVDDRRSEEVDRFSRQSVTDGNGFSRGKSVRSVYSRAVIVVGAFLIRTITDLGTIGLHKFQYRLRVNARLAAGEYVAERQSEIVSVRAIEIVPENRFSIPDTRDCDRR